MPCITETPEESARNLDREVDQLTRLLCMACTRLEMRRVTMAPSLARWWARHKRWDAKRKADERRDRKESATRRAVLKKLSRRERESIGL